MAVGTNVYEKGAVFGRLTVCKVLDRRHRGGLVYLCECSCGVYKEVPSTYLQCGGTRSCGCLQKEQASAQMTKHGMFGSAEYSAWSAMWTRCTKERCKAFKNYGARGIRVCARWKKFENFLADVGLKPDPSFQLDRLKNDKGYRPGNVEWVPAKRNARNKRNTLKVMYKDTTIPLAEAAEKAGIRYCTALVRYNKGQRYPELFRPPHRGKKA